MITTPAIHLDLADLRSSKKGSPRKTPLADPSVPVRFPRQRSKKNPMTWFKVSALRVETLSFFGCSTYLGWWLQPIKAGVDDFIGFTIDLSSKKQLHPWRDLHPPTPFSESKRWKGPQKRGPWHQQAYPSCVPRCSSRPARWVKKKNLRTWGDVLIL